MSSPRPGASLRNRIIAGLADAVVVVESHAKGGSLYTVESAMERGVTVLAVPGPVRSSASAGTNQLLADGVAPVRDADDVLVALGSMRLARALGAEERPGLAPRSARARRARLGARDLRAPRGANWHGARPPRGPAHASGGRRVDHPARRLVRALFSMGDLAETES